MSSGDGGDLLAVKRLTRSSLIFNQATFPLCVLNFVVSLKNIMAKMSLKIIALKFLRFWYMANSTVSVIL